MRFVLRFFSKYLHLVSSELFFLVEQFLIFYLAFFVIYSLSFYYKFLSILYSSSSFLVYTFTQEFGLVGLLLTCMSHLSFSLFALKKGISIK